MSPAAPRPGEAAAGHCRRQMHRAPQRIGMFPPSSSFLFKLRASKRARLGIVVIPSYSGQMGRPHTKEQGYPRRRPGVRTSGSKVLQPLLREKGQVREEFSGQQSCIAPGSAKSHSTLESRNLQFFPPSVSRQTAAQQCTPMGLSVCVCRGVSSSATVSSSAPISFPTSHPSPSPKLLAGKSFR